MDKRLWLFLLFLVLAGATSAQKAANQFRILGEGGFPVHEEFQSGWGAYLKFLYGVGRNGQATLTTGFSKFRASATLIGWNGERSHLRTIPFLVGYKHTIKGFYVEPQAGYGELGGRDYIGGDWARQSVGAFYTSLGAGYEYQRWDVGVRYQGAKGAEGVSAGSWHRRFFEFVGVHIGYTLWQRPDHTPGP